MQVLPPYMNYPVKSVYFCDPGIFIEKKKIVQATFSVTTESLGFDKINLNRIRLKGTR